MLRLITSALPSVTNNITKARSLTSLNNIIFRSSHNSTGNQESSTETDVLTFQGLGLRDTNSFRKNLKTQATVDSCTSSEEKVKQLTSFVSQEGWWESVQSNILENIDKQDPNAVINQVPFTALVGCYYGGKSRSLTEIAKRMSIIDPSLKVLYLPLSGEMALQDHEQENLVDSICQRIGYVANLDRHENTFAEHQKLQIFKGSYRVTHWINNHRVLLLIDDMDSIKGYSDTEDAALSGQAHELVKFLKKSFIGRKGSYMLFTADSYNFATSVNDTQFVFQELPRVPSLASAVELVESSHRDVRQVIYRGHIPGLILQNDWAQEEPQKHKQALQDFNGNTESKDRAFLKIVSSVINGYWWILPKELHGMLEKCTVDGQPVLRWSPMVLEYIMRGIEGLSDRNKSLATAIADLCSTFAYKESNDDEARFVVALLARCIACKPDNYFLPDDWFNEEYDLKCNEFLVPEESAQSSSHTLQQLIPTTEQPTIHIVHGRFAIGQGYDVLAVYTDRNKIVSVNGYKFKLSSPSSEASGVPTLFDSSFLVGSTDAELDSDESKLSDEWIAANSESTNYFYGDSAQHWTLSK